MLEVYIFGYHTTNIVHGLCLSVSVYVCEYFVCIFEFGYSS